MPKTLKSSQKEKIEEKKFLRAPRGMHDVLPADQPYWERIESVAKEAARLFNFGRVETPVLEFADLFIKTNEDADMVKKEMYTLKTRGGDILALRPEYTAPKMRAYMEHSLSRLGQPQRLWSFGPVFRHDRPQLGRYRQFFQLDFDIIGGSNDPIYDAEIVLIFSSLLERMKVGATILKINSIGCKICRPIYKKQLQEYYKNLKKDLCHDCVGRLETNPLRLLDCKKEDCVRLKEGAPNFLDKLCAPCSAHLKGVLEYLDELKIPYTLDRELVRGLDYYNRTVFEFFPDGTGSDIGAVIAGGRYDYLSEFLGGHLTPAVGASLGVERVIALMQIREVAPPEKAAKRVFLAYAGEPAKKKLLGLLKTLENGGISIAEAFSRDSLKAQLKAADKEKAVLALILGQKEIYEKSVIVRDMRTGLQDAVSMDKIVEEVKKRLR